MCCEHNKINKQKKKIHCKNTSHVTAIVASMWIMLIVENRNSTNNSSSSNAIQNSTNDEMLVLVCSVWIYKIKTCVCSIDIASCMLASISISPPSPPPLLVSLYSFYHFLGISFMSTRCIHLNSESTVAHNTKQTSVKQGKARIWRERKKTRYSRCKRLHRKRF